MISILGSFFASFNPFAFVAVLSLGLIILTGKPGRLRRLASELPSLEALWSHYRRGA